MFKRTRGSPARVAGVLLLFSLAGLAGCELPSEFTLNRRIETTTDPSEIVFHLPDEGTQLEEAVIVSVEGEDVARARFGIDGVEILDDDTAPFEWTLDPEAHEPGVFEIRVVAERTDGTTVERRVEVSVPAPPAPEPGPLSFDVPEDGSTLEGATTFSVSGDGIEEVAFKLDGETRLRDTSSPFAWTLDPAGLASGEYRVELAVSRFGATESLFVTIFVAQAPLPPPPGPGELDRTATMWAPYEEWSLPNPTYSGNPFDLVATATFTHRDSGTTRKTEMFFDGSDTWKFRFTGTRTGTWTFRTESDDPELDGHEGTIEVSENSDPKVRGFLVNHEGRYAIQTGNDGTLEAYRFNVYMNERDYEAHGYLERFSDPQRTRDYVQDAREKGFDTIFINELGNQWFELGAMRHDEHDSEQPDPASFRILETIIKTAHAEGARVHLWMWGDESRAWTPVGAGGINGVPDRRVQRYIAARLGPLPGWTLGYGFDLQEWVSEDQLRSWADNLHNRFGWQHLVWARGRSNSSLDVVSRSDYGIRSYSSVVSDLDSDTSRPDLYEERDTHGRIGFEATRIGLWRYTMAGGMGGFWGYFPGDSYYSQPELLKAVATFFEKRWFLDYERANHLTNNEGGYHVLKRPNNRHYVFFAQWSQGVRMDLSGMDGPQRAIAVDTKKAYQEIDLGTLNPADQEWEPPYQSDWVIAVGDFGS